MRRALALAAMATLVLTAAACGDSGKGKDGTTATASPTVTASSSDKPTPTATSASPSPTSTGGSTSVMSSSKEYDGDIGGLFQLLGLRTVGDKGVVVNWIARTKGKYPKPRLDQQPGRLDVIFPDTRVHPDVVSGLRPSSGSIKSVKFVFPADDATTIVRIQLRDPDAEPKATLVTAKVTPEVGQTQVVFGD